LASRTARTRPASSPRPLPAGFERRPGAIEKTLSAHPPAGTDPAGLYELLTEAFWCIRAIEIDEDSHVFLALAEAWEEALEPPSGLSGPLERESQVENAGAIIELLILAGASAIGAGELGAETLESWPVALCADVPPSVVAGWWR
jgi:hypothetical protein